MLYHPFILEELIRQRRAELLAGVPKYPGVMAIRSSEPLAGRLAGHVIIFIANLLIKAGTRLKKQWFLERDRSIDGYAPFLNGE